MTCALDSLDSSSAMRPSTKPCCSLAASYSAFSDRSPWARASLIDLITAGRLTVFRVCNSARSSSAPLIVKGVLLMAYFQSVHYEGAKGGQESPLLVQGWRPSAIYEQKKPF